LRSASDWLVGVVSNDQRRAPVAAFKAYNLPSPPPT